MSDDASTTTRIRAAWAAFVAIAFMVAGDLAMDSQSGVALAHVAIEVGVTLLALAGAALLWRQTADTVSRLRTDLSASRTEAARWQRQSRELVRGLGEAIDEQFSRWGLTDAEREVGLLLLKGLSLKEVARVRGTSDRTAREQAQGIYRKGDLTGRSDLSAFFLEDLLPPGGFSTDGDQLSG